MEAIKVPTEGVATFEFDSVNPDGTTTPVPVVLDLFRACFQLDAMASECAGDTRMLAEKQLEYVRHLAGGEPAINVSLATAEAFFRLMYAEAEKVKKKLPPSPWPDGVPPGESTCLPTSTGPGPWTGQTGASS